MAMSAIAARDIHRARSFHAIATAHATSGAIQTTPMAFVAMAPPATSASAGSHERGCVSRSTTATSVATRNATHSVSLNSDPVSSVASGIDANSVVAASAISRDAALSANRYTSAHASAPKARLSVRAALSPPSRNAVAKP